MAAGQDGSCAVVRVLELHTDSHPEALGEARRRVFEAMTRTGLFVDAARNMEIAVGEALSNIYRHAYADGIGPVCVEVSTGAGAVIVLVRDEGTATEPPLIPRRLPSRSNVDGRGLYLISRLADDVTVSLNQTGHGVTVRMTAYLEVPVKEMLRGGGNTAPGIPAGRH